MISSAKLSTENETTKIYRDFLHTPQQKDSNRNDIANK